MAAQPFGSPEERAAKRVEDRSAVLWHTASYVIVNAFLWIIVPDAALWVTIGWGVGLAFHLAAYFIGDDGPCERIALAHYSSSFAYVKCDDIKECFLDLIHNRACTITRY